MKVINSVLKTTLAIIGTIIGAGFISGREIITFFYGSNILLSVLIIFVLFFLAFSLFLNMRTMPNNFLIKIFEPIILFGNLIMVSSMLSAMQDASQIFFPNLIIPVLPMLALILSFLTLAKGIEGLKTFNVIFVPVIIVFSIYLLNKTSVFQPLEIGFNLKLPILICYVGVNIFMSVPVFVNLGKSLTKKELLLSALISALILAFIICYIFLGLISDKPASNSSIPFLQHVLSSKTSKIIYVIIFISGTITTLVSSHFPMLEFCNSFKNKLLTNSIFIIVVFAIAKLGFYRIVNYVYPFLGFLGTIYVILCLIVSLLAHKSFKRQDKKSVLFDKKLI